MSKLQDLRIFAETVAAVGNGGEAPARYLGEIGAIHHRFVIGSHISI